MSIEEFSVTLDVIVSSKEKSNAAESCPWQGYSSKGVSPKLLFKTKEELLSVTAEFGMCRETVNFCSVFCANVRLSNQATGYASQHYSVPVPSHDKLKGLWQKGHKNGDWWRWGQR